MILRYIAVSCRRYEYPIFCFIVALISSILCYLPFYFPQKLSIPAADETELQVTVLNDQFQLSMIVSIVISAPILVDLISDMFHVTQNFEFKVIYSLVRLLLITSFTLPGLLLVSPTIFAGHNGQGFLSCVHLRRINTTGCLFAFISIEQFSEHGGTSILPAYISVAAFLLYDIGQLISLYSYSLLSVEHSSEARIISIAFISLSYVLILHLIYLWMHRSVRSLFASLIHQTNLVKTSVDLEFQSTTQGASMDESHSPVRCHGTDCPLATSQDVCVTVYLLALLVLPLWSFVVSHFYGDVTKLHPMEKAVPADTYVNSAVAVLVLMIPGRFISGQHTSIDKSTCGDLQGLLSREVRVPMEGMLRKISALRGEMASLLTSSPSVFEDKQERDRERKEEEESLLLNDFSPSCKDSSDRYKDLDRDLGCCIGGRSQSPGAGQGQGQGLGVKEAKCLGLLPLWSESLGGIKGQCESAIIRFNDILALKDLHSGKTELAAQTINPRQFFRDRFERFDSLLRKKKINFEMVSEGEYENVHVRADPRLLGKAFESVFINAVDGTKERSSIQIMITRETRGSGKDNRKASSVGNTSSMLQSWTSGILGLNRVPFRKNSVYPRDVEDALDALKAAEEDLYQGRQGDFVVIEINEKRTVTFSPFSPGAAPYSHITGPADLEAAVRVKSLSRAQLGLGIAFAKDIIELHSGIWRTTVKDDGTGVVHTICLPLIQRNTHSPRSRPNDFRTALAELRRGSNGPGINISASVSDYLGWFVPEYVTSSRVQSPQHSGARKHVSVFQARSRRSSPKDISMPPQTTTVLTRSPFRLHAGRAMDAKETPIGPRESLWTQSGREGTTRDGQESPSRLKSDSFMVTSKVVVSVDRQSQSKCDRSTFDKDPKSSVSGVRAQKSDADSFSLIPMGSGKERGQGQHSSHTREGTHEI